MLRKLRILFLLTFELVITAAAHAQEGRPPHVVLTDPLPAAEQRKLFHLPEGFEIELVAAEPDIHKPLSINFDARGRLYISDTVEYPFPPKGPGRDSLKRLTDTDGEELRIPSIPWRNVRFPRSHPCPPWPSTWLPRRSSITSWSICSRNNKT